MRKSLFSSIVNLPGALLNYVRPILSSDVCNQSHAAIDAAYEDALSSPYSETPLVAKRESPVS
jgi:hypothetical protein